MRPGTPPGAPPTIAANHASDTRLAQVKVEVQANTEGLLKQLSENSKALTKAVGVCRRLEAWTPEARGKTMLPPEPWR